MQFRDFGTKRGEYSILNFCQNQVSIQCNKDRLDTVTAIPDITSTHVQEFSLDNLSFTKIKNTRQAPTRPFDFYKQTGCEKNYDRLRARKATKTKIKKFKKA